MKISDNTKSILKNFSGINSNIQIKPGNVIKTLAPTKSIFAEATVDETFATTLGLYDLNKFLATVSLFKEPSFDFKENHVEISGASSKVRYFYSDPSLLTVLPKSFSMPEHDVEFNLSAKDFAEIQKAAAVLQVSDLSIETKNSDIIMKVYQKNDETSNSFEIKVGENSNNLSFKLLFNVNNLKLLPGNYTVKISKKKISEFSHDNLQLKYWITLEADSEWND